MKDFSFNKLKLAECYETFFTFINPFLSNDIEGNGKIPLVCQITYHKIE